MTPFSHEPCDFFPLPVTNSPHLTAQVLKSLLEDLASRQQPIVFWNWKRVLVSMFVGFDNKGSEYFRHHETLELLVQGETKQFLVEENYFSFCLTEGSKKFDIVSQNC